MPVTAMTKPDPNNALDEIVINDPSSPTAATKSVNCNRSVMAPLGNCHRTIHTVQRPQNKDYLLRKPLPAQPATFGDRFRATRVAHGHTQTEIGRKLGVSLSTVKFWEQDRTLPATKVRAQVQAFLNTVPPGKHP
jgi:DNA-binding XRE family transcriptional regulator